MSDDSSPVERAAARQHLVQHAAEGPDVGALVHRLAARLLRRHVRRGAEDHAHAASCAGDVIVGESSRSPTVWRRRAEPPAPWPGRSRAPSPCRRRVTLMLAGFEIAMDDAPARARPRALRRSAARSRSASSIASRAARDALATGRRPRPAPSRARRTPPCLLEAVDVRDVRMIERREHLRLALKRASRSGSAANGSGRTLIATSRFSFVSRARYTSPIPPSPMRRGDFVRRRVVPRFHCWLRSRDLSAGDYEGCS